VSLGFSNGAWLQTAARSMLADGAIDWTLYALCVARLASRRHGHVSLDGDTLIAMLRHEHGKVLIDAAANYIGGPRAEIVSHAHAVADFINKAWSSGVPSWRAGAAASLLITRLISKRTEWWETLELLNRKFGQAAVPGTRPDLSRLYLLEWVRGHFLSKPKVVGKRAVQQRRGKRRTG
jgi:cellulose synthase operon protein C